MRRAPAAAVLFLAAVGAACGAAGGGGAGDAGVGADAGRGDPGASIPDAGPPPDGDADAGPPRDHVPDDVAPPPVPPRVTSVHPARGPTQGGTLVQIAGGGFEPDARVFFGAVEAYDVVIAGGDRLSARAPTARDLGPVTVTVALPDGRAGELAGAFTYFEAWFERGGVGGGALDGRLSARIVSMETGAPLACGLVVASDGDGAPLATARTGADGEAALAGDALRGETQVTGIGPCDPCGPCYGRAIFAADASRMVFPVPANPGPCEAYRPEALRPGRCGGFACPESARRFARPAPPPDDVCAPRAAETIDAEPCADGEAACREVCAYDCPLAAAGACEVPMTISPHPGARSTPRLSGVVTWDPALVPPAGDRLDVRAHEFLCFRAATSAPDAGGNTVAAGPGALIALAPNEVPPAAAGSYELAARDGELAVYVLAGFCHLDDDGAAVMHEPFAIGLRRHVVVPACRDAASCDAEPPACAAVEALGVHVDTPLDATFELEPDPAARCDGATRRFAFHVAVDLGADGFIAPTLEPLSGPDLDPIWGSATWSGSAPALDTHPFAVRRFVSLDAIRRADGGTPRYAVEGTWSSGDALAPASSARAYADHAPAEPLAIGPYVGAVRSWSVPEGGAFAWRTGCGTPPDLLVAMVFQPVFESPPALRGYAVVPGHVARVAWVDAQGADDLAGLPRGFTYWMLEAIHDPEFDPAAWDIFHALARDPPAASGFDVGTSDSWAGAR